MSSKPKFQFNPETLSFEKVEKNFHSFVRKSLIQIFTSLFIGFIMFLGIDFLMDSPKEKQLKKENKTMSIQYKLLSRKANDMQEVLDNLKQRDNNLYRVIFQADPIPDDVRHFTKENSRRYEELKNYPTTKLMTSTSREIDDLAKQIYIQSKSYDEIVNLAKNNENKLQHVPAIQPVLNKDLHRIASGFGWRIDPIYHTRKFHSGLDFTAPIGTDIFATGDGTVTYAKWMQGYGNTIIINHGFNYETLYGHLSKILVKNGEKVTRGNIIGLVGSTGKSTGPHLHYEVHYKDRPVDPVNYFYLDLSPEEYDKMIQMASNAGQVLD